MSVVTNIQASQQQSRPADVSAVAKAGIVETDISARLDSLGWSGFHTRVIAALGITWILDGLEVTLGGCAVWSVERKSHPQV